MRSSVRVFCSVTSLNNSIAVIVLLPVIAAGLGCSGRRQQLRKEETLRQDLFVLRSEIGQFTVDHQRPPDSLSQLVTTGYLKQIPTDPVTGNKDSWKVERGGDVLEVHSGSDGIASNGSRYSSW
jgi:general secretion pathway protein G